MAKKIIEFHGSIAHLLPHPVEVNADTTLEAMSALVEMYPELKKFTSFDDRPVVQLVGFETTTLLRSPTEVEVIHVVPAMIGSGGGGGGFMRIVIGAVIIAAAIAFAPGAYGALAAGNLTGAMSAITASGWMGTLALNLGTSLILGGLLSLISPVPRRDAGLDAAADPAASKYLGASQNTVRIGTRIPIPYGECRVGGHYISFDSQATDVAV